MPLNMGYVPVSIEAVRGQGYRHDREGALKASAIRRQAVDVGRLDLLVSVAAEMVGAQRVDGDQDDIQRRLRGRLRRRTEAR